MDAIVFFCFALDWTILRQELHPTGFRHFRLRSIPGHHPVVASAQQLFAGMTREHRCLLMVWTGNVELPSSWGHGSSVFEFPEEVLLDSASERIRLGSL
jgi:hypothetical protein